MPPVKRAGGIVVGRADDGRLVHTFRQSTLNELDACPERGRATMAGLMPDAETDAACLGTAVHAGIEHGLRAPEPVGLDELLEAAHGEFSRLSELPTFHWRKYKEPKARTLIDSAVEVFYDELYHVLDPVLIEHGFGPLVIYEDDERIIQITGTIDLFERTRGAVDFKTTGQAKKYKRGWGGDAWRLDRWAIQPTVYCEALRQLGHYDDAGPWPFTFYAFNLERKDVELIEAIVLRRPEDVAWLRGKTLAYAKLVEADVDQWPKQDNHELCSPKWCDWWDECKGAHYVEVEWPLKPAA